MLSISKTWIHNRLRVKQTDAVGSTK